MTHTKPTDEDIQAAKDWLDHTIRGRTIYKDHPVYTVYAALEAYRPVDAYPVLPCDFRVGKTTFKRGVKIDLLQRSIDDLLQKGIINGK